LLGDGLTADKGDDDRDWSSHGSIFGGETQSCDCGDHASDDARGDRIADISDEIRTRSAGAKGCYGYNRRSAAWPDAKGAEFSNVDAIL
jgi:hypothetical protein